MRRPDCFLCGDLTDRGGRIALGAGLALTSDIAPLAPGHLLLHTDDHVASFAAADPATLAKCKTGVDELLKHPLLRGRPVLLFEHGTDGAKPTDAGCTDHAHIHILPVPLDSGCQPATDASGAIARLHAAAAGPFVRFEDLGQLAGTNYFWLADRDLILRTVRPEPIERQILRRIVANALKLNRHRSWDLFDEDGARVTMKKWRDIESGGDFPMESVE